MENYLERETVPCAARSRWVTPCPSIFSNPFLMISCTIIQTSDLKTRNVHYNTEVVNSISNLQKCLDTGCWSHFACLIKYVIEGCSTNLSMLSEFYPNTIQSYNFFSSKVCIWFRRLGLIRYWS